MTLAQGWATASDVAGGFDLLHRLKLQVGIVPFNYFILLLLT